MKNRKLKKWIAAFAAAILLAGCAAERPQKTDLAKAGQTEAAQAGNTGSLTQEAADAADSVLPAFADDFYEAVNHERLKEWEIPSHMSEISWFSLLDEERYKRIDEEIRAAASEKELSEGSDAWNVAAFYLTGLDKEARNKGGLGEAAGSYVKAVDAAGSVSELLELSIRFQREYSIYSLGAFSYSADYEDSSKKILYALGADTGLAKEIWFSDEEQNQEMVNAYIDYLRKLHVQAGAAEEEAEKIVERVTGMMRALAEASLSIEERYDAKNTYHVYQVSELPDFLLNGLVSEQLLKELYGTDSDESVIIEDIELAQCVSEWLKEENLSLLKEYVKSCLYSDTAAYRELEAQEALQEYLSQIRGIEIVDFERYISESVQETLDFQCGRLFCDKYFSEESKREVEELVGEVISTYDKRIAALTWMSEDTKAEARKKLAAVKVSVGYPDKWPQDRYALSLVYPQDGGLYMDNFFRHLKARQDFLYSTKDEPVDKAEWITAPQLINAYYDPSSNSITLLAGILQGAFYSPNASAEEKLGGIGMVIAHEITHAFDTNGSQYDENGNLRNWWTEEDLKNFEALAAQVERYYSGMELDGRQIDGKLTLTENIADLGALACISQIAQEKGYDLKAMYCAYANIWAEKVREEYMAYLLVTDVHSPGKIRVNAVLSALHAFYDTFDVKEGDKMYQKPENRPKIW
ncbi:MAG: M13 family metallopeptidase [Lachnospiraceae bacterium]|nr:M13 family metallopeptidase [Lachnospiraceae bacterium]